MDDDAALRWAVRRDAGALTPEDRAALDAWLAADARRAGALLRAEAALAYLDRGRALGEGEGEGEGEGDAGAAPAMPGRRNFLVAGALAAAAGFGGFLLLSSGGSGEAIATDIGEVRRLPLADGSVATLNTASRIAVAIQPRRRMVALEAGEAWFQVAHDPVRPFVVDAGPVRVRAVGTAFSVRRDAAGISILVTEGTVESWIVGHERQAVRMAAGAQAFVPADAAAIAAVDEPEAVERALAWRNGDLALSGEPLSRAVAELNRYNRIKLRVDDLRLRREPVVGYFRTSEPENFARSIAPLIGARVESGDGELRIVPERGD